MVVSLFQFDMKISTPLSYLLDIALIFRGLEEISDILIFREKKKGAELRVADNIYSENVQKAFYLKVCSLLS